jgi:hypothetical protein
MSGEDAPRPCLENLIVPEIKTNKQIWRGDHEQHTRLWRETFPSLKTTFLSRFLLSVRSCPSKMHPKSPPASEKYRGFRSWKFYFFVGKRKFYSGFQFWVSRWRAKSGTIGSR